MQDGLQQADPDLTVYGCSAQWLNLLDQDLTTHSVMGQKHCQNYHQPCTWLTECTESDKPQVVK